MWPLQHLLLDAPVWIRTQLELHKVRLLERSKGASSPEASRKRTVKHTPRRKTRVRCGVSQLDSSRYLIYIYTPNTASILARRGASSCAGEPDSATIRTEWDPRDAATFVAVEWCDEQGAAGMPATHCGGEIRRLLRLPLWVRRRATSRPVLRRLVDVPIKCHFHCVLQIIVLLSYTLLANRVHFPYPVYILKRKPLDGMHDYDSEATETHQS